MGEREPGSLDPDGGNPTVSTPGAGSAADRIRSVRTTLRALLRFLAFTMTNLALAALYFLAFPATIGSPSRRTHLRNWVFRTWSRVSLACAGARLEVRGEPPEGPCFLVANHIVYTDIWVLAATTSAVFVAQSGIARWPFFGTMAKAMSIIFVDRRNNRSLPEVNRRMEAELDRGQVIAIFPESRTSPGDRLLPFRSSLLEPAARGKHPVAWAAIDYRTGPDDPPPSEVVVWPDGVSVASHAAKLLRLDRLDARVTFGGEPVRGGDRKALTAELQRKVESIFTPMD
jgi:1-acyl-sn-glycerol-3-phosphate acyltransferase